MAKILSDHDVEGHLAVLLAIWTSDDWRGLWEELDGSVSTLASLGLSRHLSDRELWRYCQANELILLTGNRNADSPDSLEATIQTESQPDSLPVLTIGDPGRMMLDGEYAEAAAVKVLDYLMELDALRGSRRLFVP